RLEPLDALRALAPQVALDLQLRIDVTLEAGDLLVGQVAHLRVGREAELGAHLLRRGLADAVDVRQPDLEPLLIREVDPCDSRHSCSTPVAACAVAWCRCPWWSR